jgi:peptide/nickel transport system permease protein
MLRYALRRIPSGLFILGLASVVIFLLLRTTGGDPAAVKAGSDASPAVVAAIRLQLGLDDPLIVQYFHWLTSLLTGNLGNSLVTDAPIASLITNGLQATFLLTLSASFLAVVIGLALGIAIAIQSGVTRTIVDGIASLMLAVPTYVSGVLMILVLSVTLNWLPVGGYRAFFQDPEIAVQYLAMPALCLALPAAGVLARFLATSMRQIMDEDFVTTGMAKGLSPTRLLLRHILPNALPPVFTVLGIQVGQMLGGAIVVEAIFAWPGIGSVLANATLSRDYYLIQDLMLISVAVFIVIQVMTDLAHAALDSRIRLEGSQE